MLLDACAQLRVHVLHGPGPRPLKQAAPVAEVLPRQRFGSERDGRGVVPTGRHGTTAAITGSRSRSAGHRTRHRSILSHCELPLNVDDQSDYERCHCRA